MRFNESDAGEKALGKSASQLDMNDYMPYCQTMARQVLGHPIPFDKKDRTLFRRLTTLYGASGTGLLLKWIFFHYSGYIDGEPFNMSRFSQGWKWWTDKAFAEASQAMEPEKSALAGNFGTLEDLLASAS